MKTVLRAAIAASVLACATAAQAVTVKFTDFAPTTAAIQHVHGVAQLSHNLADDTTSASVELSGLDRDTNYVVYVASDGPGALVQVMTTYGGTASLKVAFAQDATTQNPVVYVFAGTLETITAADLRAQGL